MLHVASLLILDLIKFVFIDWTMIIFKIYLNFKNQGRWREKKISHSDKERKRISKKKIFLNNRRTNAIRTNLSLHMMSIRSVKHLLNQKMFIKEEGFLKLNLKKKVLSSFQIYHKNCIKHSFLWSPKENNLKIRRN